MIPPLMTVGSSPAASSSVATSDVVVVLPWVPETATHCLSRISSASISARRTTGMRRARAATTSGLSRLTADETTTTAAWPRFALSWPIAIVAPFSRSRLTLALSERSEPWTVWPRLMSTSAMPDMPMPPMPTKWMGPIWFGSFMPAYLPRGRWTGPDLRAAGNSAVRGFLEIDWSGRACARRLLLRRQQWKGAFDRGTRIS